MTVTAAIPAWGTYIAYGNGGDPETFTPFAEVREITEVGGERDTPEVTHLLSPDQAKEFIATLLDSGVIGLKLNYIPTNTTHKFLIANTIQQTFTEQDNDYQIVWPDDVDGSATFAFVGKFKKAKVVGPIDQQITLDCELQVTGIISVPE